MTIISSPVMIMAEGKSSLLPNSLPQKPQAFTEWLPEKNSAICKASEAFATIMENNLRNVNAK